LRLLFEACANNPRGVEGIGGNVLLHIPDVGTWTLVTKGVEPGIHEGATDDVMDFALICKEFVLFNLLDPNPSPYFHERLEEYLEKGMLRVQGDVSVFARLLDLVQPKRTALSLLLQR
jgi:hypothetical protein